ncbi:MAG: putative lipid II flippase FtsW [Mailhella sp.]|nr:putative lipid II flippase FtsW [Mailhella sp.]
MNVRITPPQQASAEQEVQGPIDYWLLALLLIILCIGLLAVLSASGPVSQREFKNSYHFFYHQLFTMGLGGVLIIILCLIPRKIINNSHYWAIAASIILLLLCILIGPKINGSRRWINLHYVMLQPMEFARIALVLYLAYFLGSKQAIVKFVWRGIFPPLIISGMLIGLIMLQPDLGGAILLALICFFMLLAGGSKIRHLIGVLLPLAILVGIAIIVSPYRIARVFAFLHPFDDMRGNGWQLVQSLLALGSGGMFGVGLGGSIQKTGPLPEAHNDFIMSIVGEEIGFAGIVVIMILFALFFYRCYRVVLGQKSLRDRLCAFGLTLAMAQSFLLNLAVILGAVPPKGIAMPFISYGGSSLLANMICAGLLLHYSRTSRE